MQAAESGYFTCNVCGADCVRPPGGLGREIANCTVCKSTVRLRALIALLSQEIFGVLLALPEFPVLKGIRAIGMSDAPDLADRLTAKFDYTNTFYHQAPQFDVTTPDPRDEGRYDFILSSEVMEHVPPPVENSFAILNRLLKPDGFLLMTTPYTLGGKTAEHFPALHEYTLAAPGGQMVLVNRRKDGAIEIFENLAFHGGHGSTLEMRLFTETSLRDAFRQTGFSDVHFAVKDWPEFGVEHSETWSLPISARKGTFRPPAGELAREYREACRKAARAERDLSALAAEYERHIAFHNLAHDQHTKELTERTEWARKTEREFEERTQWAQDLNREKLEAIHAFENERDNAARAHERAQALARELEATREELNRLQSAFWTRLGRRIGRIR